MVYIDLVQRIRDSNPGQNTLICIDEIVPLGLNILLFRDGVPTRENKDGIVDEFRDQGFSVVDAKWIAAYKLNDTGGDAQLRQLADRASNQSANFRVDYHSTDYPQQSRRLEELRHREKNARAEFRYFRPSVISQRIAQADLVVVPPSLAAKVADEIPGANIAVLAERVDGSIPLLTAITGINYPRILVRQWPLRLEYSGQPRVDDDTLRLLMNREPENSAEVHYTPSRLDQRMDSLFYRALQRLDIPNALHINRTLIPAARGSFKFKTDPDSDIFDGDFSGYESGSFDARREVVTNLRPNGYGLGRSSHYNDIRAIDLAGAYEQRKKEQIKKMYESMWLCPLDSIDEVVERKNIIGELLGNQDLSGRMQNLSRDFNRIYGLHLHLDGMSRNLTANLLHSKWGAVITQKPFYTDFTGLAREFIAAYESIAQNMIGINSSSRELQVVIEPLRHFMEGGNDLHAAYSFLKDVMRNNPSNYMQLAQSFSGAIENLGIKKIDELEKYDKGPVPEERRRVTDGDDFEDFEALEQRKATRNKNDGKSKKSGPTERTLHGYKPPELKKLIDQFFGQVPVVRAKRAVKYMDYAGSKIAAYMAYADFMMHEGKGWTRPQIIAPENGIIDIRGGWYPLTRMQHTRDYVRNDTYLDQYQRVEVLDGANIGGKTTDLRKSLFIVLLALSGSYVPAEQARISFFDGLRYRIKNTGMGESGAFAEELRNIHSALGQFNGRCVYGFDETFTSTNDVEGEALTYGLIKRIALNPNARGIFTSHYPSLHDIANDATFNGVTFSHFTFDVKNGKLQFSHKKMEGPNKIGDYAIVIAEHEGLPSGIIAHAKNYRNGAGA